MAKFLDLPAIQAFDATSDTSGISQRWTKWKQGFSLYVTAVGVDDDEQKRAMFLHLAGSKVQDIFGTFRDTGNDYKTAVEKLDEYFLPKKNVAFERHVFRQAKQEDGECMDAYVTRLKQLAATCEYGDRTDEMLRDQIVDKCKSAALRRKLLHESKLDIEKCLEIARVMEAVDTQAKEMENTGTVNQVSTTSTRDKYSQKNYSCYRCGLSGHFARNCSIAKDKDCRKCGKLGHLERVCKSRVSSDFSRQGAHRGARGGAATRSRGGHSRGRKWKSRVNFVDNMRPEVIDTDVNNDCDSETEYIFSLSDNDNSEEGKVQVRIGQVQTEILVDSGATVNIMNSELCEKLQQTGCTLEKTGKTIYPYASEIPLDVQGKITTEVSCGGQSLITDFVLVPGRNVSLLSRKTSIQLGVLKIGVNAISSEYEHLQQEFGECFQGLGKLKDFQLKLHIDSDVKPVAQPLRRLPFHLRKQVENKLKELEEVDVIEKVTGPTPWVSPLVVVPKSQSEIRICVDMRQGNQAVVRERHPIPTVEDIISDMNGSTVFTKLDLKWGYHQIELHSESRDITTFSSHIGLFRYKRLMFGINSAPEMYQHIVSQTLQGCDGVNNLSDDIIIHGKETQEHDRRLRAVMQRLKEAGLTLNVKKCKFGLSRLVFMGHVFSQKGIEPEESKIQAVVDAKTPENPAEIRSFLGLVNFCGRFIPNLATISEPLRKLTRKNNEWSWGREQGNAFKTLKNELASANVMAYFSTSAKTRVIVDASPVGLGAILTQEQQDSSYRPVIYASRTLSDTERRYSQTEKEALAVVWGCERFKLYLYGSKFELITDHKPLEVIYSHSSKPPARIERWVLRLQPFDFTVTYRPGPTNAADALSRLTQKKAEETKNVAEEYIRFVTQHSVPKAVSVEEIRAATEKDAELSKLKRSLEEATESRYSGSYKSQLAQMSVCDGVVLKGCRIVIPANMKNRILRIAHETHPGVVRTKQILREKVWWPSMNEDAERLVKNCHACQVVSSIPVRPEPMKSTELPSGPWKNIAIDLCGPFPSGENLLVVVDFYSRWPEIALLRSTTTRCVTKSLNKIFARHGLPETLTSDNGPQFIGHEFKQYLDENGIVHRRVTPYWPQANGEVERMNRSILKAIKTANLEKKDWRTELPKFLLSYRTTPHATTNMTPAEMLMNRKLKTKIPEIQVSENLDSEVRNRDKEIKKKGKKYADSARKAEKSELEVGDQVLLRQERSNKLSTNFNPQPYTVVEKSGNSLTVRNEEQQIRRNSSHMKKFYESTSNEGEGDSIGEAPSREIIQPDQQSDADDHVSIHDDASDCDVPLRRSARTKIVPARFSDYELY